MQRMRTGLLSLSGYNVRAVVALCRWAAAAGVPLHLIARSAEDPLYRTAHADRIWGARTSPTLSVTEVADWVRMLRARFGYDRVVLVPSTEFFNRFILSHRAELTSAGAIVPLVEEALYACISDKAAFSALCARHGIDVPHATDTPPATGAFVAKPRHYAASKVGRVKPYLVHDAAERAAFLAAEDREAYFYQEYVHGESLYLLLHVGRDGTVQRTSQENLLQQHGGGSVILARAHRLHEEPEAERYVRLLRDVEFHGLIMIEVRRSTETGRTVMIEANPRLWGPIQFTLDHGVDLFSPWYADITGAASSAVDLGVAPGPYYFWSGGLAESDGAPMYHNFTTAEFEADLARITASDLFARADTLALHHADFLSPVPA